MEPREMAKLSMITSEQVGPVVLELCKKSPVNNGGNIKKLYAHTMATIDFLIMEGNLILKKEADAR